MGSPRAGDAAAGLKMNRPRVTTPAPVWGRTCSHLFSLPSSQRGTRRGQPSDSRVPGPRAPTQLGSGILGGKAREREERGGSYYLPAPSCYRESPAYLLPSHYSRLTDSDPHSFPSQADTSPITDNQLSRLEAPTSPMSFPHTPSS